MPEPVPTSVFTGWIQYILDNWGMFTTLLGDHLVMVGVGELLAILIAVPAGIAASRHPTVSTVVMNLGAVAQTVPALGVVALTFTILGLGKAPTILAITIYALFPILKNTVAGLTNIDDAVIQAGRGMGMSSVERLRLIELPLALPVIFAGIRQAAVLVVGITTIAAFFGAGGLGRSIFAGIRLDSTKHILGATVIVSAIAIALDYGLGIVQRQLPGSRRRAHT